MWHSGMIKRYAIKRYAHIKCRENRSEYRHDILKYSQAQRSYYVHALCAEFSAVRTAVTRIYITCFTGRLISKLNLLLLVSRCGLLNVPGLWINP
jgi:hypothetical protein